MKTRTGFLLLTLVVTLTSCDKKYKCRCTGYEGLKSAKVFKFRAENNEIAKDHCKNYEEGNESDGTDCELIP